MIRGTLRAFALVLLVALAAPALAGGQEAEDPAITVDRAAVRPGDGVVLTLTGFTGRVVTVSVCGNLAARASADCNQVASEGIGRNRDGSPTSRDFIVLAPPVHCPCVLRAATTTNDEVAVAPIEILGHPVGPVVGPAGVEPVAVEVTARRAPRGLLGSLRSALGGPTPYELTVSVANNTGQPLDGVALAGAGRRGGDDVTELELPPPGVIEVGARWEHTLRTTVPAPAVGSVRWEITASGAGPATTATTTSRTTPVLLLVVVLALLVDLGAIAWRTLARRRVRTAARPGGSAAMPA